jgi:hypothetical protein
MALKWAIRFTSKDKLTSYRQKITLSVTPTLNYSDIEGALQDCFDICSWYPELDQPPRDRIGRCLGRVIRGYAGDGDLREDISNAGVFRHVVSW